MPIKKTILLGERLIQKNLISRQGLDRALREHERTGRFLGATVVNLGLIKEEELCPVLSEHLKIPYVKIKELIIAPSVLEKVSAKYACHYKIIPVKFDKADLTIAVTDPLDIKTLDDLRLFLGYEVEIGRAHV